MTEADWLGSDDPGRMLEYLRGRAGDRKLPLFAAACCRRPAPWYRAGRRGRDRGGDQGGAREGAGGLNGEGQLGPPHRL